MTSFLLGQAETDHANVPLVQGDAKYLEAQTIERIIGRAIDLEDMTLMAQIASNQKWTPLRDVDPVATPGKMVCGAFGSTLAAMQAISNGSFKLAIDGETAIEISALDFSKIKSIGATSATCVCGALGTNLAGIQAVTTGAFKITVDATVIELTGLDFSAITALDEIADTINFKAAGRFLAFYDSKSTKVWFRSLKTGSLSTLSALSAPTGGTDISGAGFLNGLTGTAVLVQGAGSDEAGLTMADVINAKAAGRFTALWDGVQFSFISPTLGVDSAISVLTAGTVGTFISGAGYLNGLTGTGTATAGTGLDGSHLPAGIYRGGKILAASIAAADTSGEILLPGSIIVNENELVLENSLDLDTTVIPEAHMTIRAYLNKIGIFPQTTKAADAQF
jgi:hypothetical protein